MEISWLYNLFVTKDIYEEFERRLNVIYTMITLTYNSKFKNFINMSHSQLELSFDGYDVFIHYGNISKRITEIEIFDREGDYLFSGDGEIIDALTVLEDILGGKEVKKLYD